MNEAKVTNNFKVICFDLPWHGKSSPPAGWQEETYRLESKDYAELILAITKALALDRPVVMGCSIGGRIVLHLALHHRSEEHTSELQSLMRISYAVFCLKKKNIL